MTGVTLVVMAGSIPDGVGRKLDEWQRLAALVQLEEPIQSGLEPGLDSLRSARTTLFLEQVLERLPGISGLGGGRGRGLFFPRYADFIRRTLVGGVLARHAFFDRLHAFEAAARVEIHALLAGMQFESTLGAFAIGRDCLQHGPALRTTRHLPRARHVHRPRAERQILF